MASGPSRFPHAAATSMVPQSVLSRTFTVSLLLHAAVIGLLALETSRRPIFSDAPLRVRILPPAAPAAPIPAPPPAGGPGAGQMPREVVRPVMPPTRGERPTERLIPRPIPTPDKPPIPEKPFIPDKPAVPSPPAQATAPPAPEPTRPQPDKAPEPLREAPDPPAPQRSGLSLGGPPPGAPAIPWTGESAPPAGRPAKPGAARPSLREQIARLGSGLSADLGGPADRTISLDSRERYFVDYLARLKRRIQGVWEYPEEAIRHGISGELLILFTLNKAGSLTYIQLVQSSGYPILDEESLRAIKLAAPFDPFSPEMGDEPMNISAAFHYDLLRHFRRN